ncbi:hypothetical protein Q4E93_24970 [Flavitalea sp. BT771]|uniref:hypothetical protein n=1 Tax=Flavitalea sp. BT771 TaxID=3063329 RepID=UPI0026E1FA12|nr:hypothetical protein [Flavitalea sp. BT771]MDO6433883.1 hypothetical protein [Flavitalea sp. BT771]MDV6222212.1 hypothetical protein [Flavitalea sp. BT771]
MKKSKIFIGCAAFALAIGGFLATKANKKFANFDVKIAGAASGLSGSLSASTTNYTTVQSGSLRTVMLKTNVGNTKLATLVTAISGAHRVYYK